jgi:uncharacterized damage-inducible protein DinB
MSPSTLKSLFAYKAWANAELFQALAGVSVELYPMELHTALRTMNHIHVVDRIFCAHLLGRPHGYQATNTAETPSLPDLQAAVAATDAWYLHYVESASSRQLAEVVDFSFTDGDAGCMRREEILLHLITHGSYHRGAVGQVIKGISVTPPRELLTRFLHLSESEQADEDSASDD